MKQYMISVYQPDGGPRRRRSSSRSWTRSGGGASDLKAAGAWVFTGALQPASTATVVRVQDGEMMLTDGPFAEGKEHLGGFTVILAGRPGRGTHWSRRFAEITGLPARGAAGL